MRAEGNIPKQGITICIPNWNHSSFLPRSLGSAIRSARELEKQGLGCEILAIDDASRDGSQRVLRSIRQMHQEIDLKCLYLKKNQGLSRVRNLGMKKAKYPFVCFLDADNELIPDNLYLFYRTLQETGAALTYGNLLVLEGKKTVKLYSHEVIQSDIFEGNYVDAFCLVDRMQIIACGGYDPSLIGWEDWDLILHLICEGKRLVFCPLLFGVYHRLDNSMAAETDENWTLRIKQMTRRFNQNYLRSSEREILGRMYVPGLGYLDHGEQTC